MEGSGSSGFDMSKMSTAEKLLAGGSILLLIDSFLPWQSFELGGDILNLGSVNFNMWQGNGSLFGVLAGLLAIALIVVGVLSMTGSMANTNMGSMSADKLTGFLGAGVVVFGVLKFLLVLTNDVSWGAFVGLVLIATIAYGAWEKIQSSGGFQMGGGTGGTMGGGTPPPSAPPPSAPPPSAPPPSAPPPSTPPPSTPPMEPPPSGGMPPSGSSDM
jgi:hypothetical protein